MDINEIVASALEALKAGGLILYPTDTVWGIGCDATNEAAVQKVFALKQRSGAKSLVTLCADLDMVARHIRKIPSIAIDLVDVNDAPMTIVYPGAMGLAPSVVAEDGSVGMRIPYVAPEEEVPAPKGKACGLDSRYTGAGLCREIMRKLRRPIVSTSANISGEPTPVDFAHVSPQIVSGVDYVVPESFKTPGGCWVSFDRSATGRASQIIKLGLDGEVEIIRP